MDRSPAARRPHLRSRRYREIAAVACALALLGARYPAEAEAQLFPWQVAKAPEASSAQLAEYQRRVQLLDDNNRQLHTQLAQSEQQRQVYREELELVRQQLADTTRQLQEARRAAGEAAEKFAGLKDATAFRGGASITANTGLKKLAEQLDLGGLPVTYEGDVIRIRIPADQLFQPGTAQLHGRAAELLDPVARAVQQSFARQRIGIEGYTDDRPGYGGRFNSNHQLAAAQAMAVFDLLTRRNRLQAEQLFVLAQGPNFPRSSNDSAAGRAANRRIEIVIYPERI